MNAPRDDGWAGAAAPSEDLVEAALEVLVAAHELAPEYREGAVEDWGRQSPQHAAALREAEATWDALARVPDRSLGAVDRIRLVSEVAMASARDYPGRLGVGFCFLIALVLGPLILELTSTPGISSGLYERYLAQGDREVDRIATDRREQREVTLSGGALLWLNWNSEVLIAELEDGVHVDVRLGDALFSIPDAPRRALVVHAGEAVVHPGPGEFAIHTHGPEDALFQVRAGVIEIAGASEGDVQRIGASQQTFFREGKGHEVRAVDAASVASWQRGKLVFNERSLTTVLHVLGHYTGRKLTVGEIADDLTEVSATYPIDRADKVLFELAAAYDLELMEPSEHEWIVRSAGVQQF